MPSVKAVPSRVQMNLLLARVPLAQVPLEDSVPACPPATFELLCPAVSMAFQYFLRKAVSVHGHDVSSVHSRD